MTINEAKVLARQHLSKNGDPGVLVGYKDLGTHFGFFVSNAISDSEEVGSGMLLVSKKNGIASWRSIRSIGPKFLTSNTISL